jgi:molybdenum cofactor guanylyltransferase
MYRRALLLIITPAECTVAILIGGRAERMGGRPKGLIQFRGHTIIDRLVDEARHLARSCALIGRGSEAYAHLPNHIERWPDHPESPGPIAGLLTALERAETSWVWVLACDLPLITAKSLEPLARAWERHPLSRSLEVALYQDGSRGHPLAALWHRRALPAVKQTLRAERSLQSLCQSLPHLQLTPADPSVLTNLNHTYDLKRWERELSSK